MATLTIKKFPDSLLARLKRTAAGARRSVTQEVLVRLEDSLKKKPAGDEAPFSADAERQAAAWEALAGRWESTASVQEEIDSLYKARTKGRKVNL